MLNALSPAIGLRGVFAFDRAKIKVLGVMNKIFREKIVGRAKKDKKWEVLTALTAIIRALSVDAPECQSFSFFG